MRGEYSPRASNMHVVTIESTRATPGGPKKLTFGPMALSRSPAQSYTMSVSASAATRGAARAARNRSRVAQVETRIAAGERAERRARSAASGLRARRKRKWALALRTLAPLRGRLYISHPEAVSPGCLLASEPGQPSRSVSPRRASSGRCRMSLPTVSQRFGGRAVSSCSAARRRLDCRVTALRAARLASLTRPARRQRPSS